MSGIGESISRTTCGGKILALGRTTRKGGLGLRSIFEKRSSEISHQLVSLSLGGMDSVYFLWLTEFFAQQKCQLKLAF